MKSVAIPKDAVIDVNGFMYKEICGFTPKYWFQEVSEELSMPRLQYLKLFGPAEAGAPGGAKRESRQEADDQVAYRSAMAGLFGGLFRIPYDEAALHMNVEAQTVDATQRTRVVLLGGTDLSMHAMRYETEHTVHVQLCGVTRYVLVPPSETKHIRLYPWTSELRQRAAGYAIDVEAYTDAALELGLHGLNHARNNAGGADK